MNENYQTQKQRSSLMNITNDQVSVKTPMLPLMLNDLAAATQGTAELVESLEARLSPISSPSVPIPCAPPEKDVPLPEALEFLRSSLRRLQATNDRLMMLRNRVEV